ncbi:alpha/beta hydrolase [Sphingomonas sp.]|uniref:alpha/beta hydrolase n=1 Tax=Sphingomonas sp. TaxID=28214 RepID=UPI002BFBDA72|nr:alpha/beta hydrolase [Sphingomonas sp.]HWK36981.1 alpha/beta hydrolase [Sphingomonas sp.]
MPVPLVVSLQQDREDRLASMLAEGGVAEVQRLALDLSKAHRGLWALQLDEVIKDRRQPVVLVAQGVSCLAVAWWAQLSPRSYLRAVAGALFLSPLSFTIGQAAIARGLRPSPGTRLPFPSITVDGASAIIRQVLDLADGWGSRFVEASAPFGEETSAVERQLSGLLAILRGDDSAIGQPAPRDRAGVWRPVQHGCIPLG